MSRGEEGALSLILVFWTRSILLNFYQCFLITGGDGGDGGGEGDSGGDSGSDDSGGDAGSDEDKGTTE